MKHATHSETSQRPLDLICLGRLAVDLYSQQVGARLEDSSSFAKYLGGSSGNIAFGTARLGLKSSMLTRVGDDHMGRFLIETLQAEGCDTSHIAIDPQRLTALVLLGIKDRETFPLIFYRENCADMAVSPADFDDDYIASAKGLLITGTHLSSPQVLETSLAALQAARRHDVKTVLDIDYRPVLWGLTARADGENRYVASDKVSSDLQKVLPLFDLIVGTEEEFMIAGGSSDILAALHQVRSVTKATLVLKRGADGCNVFEHEIPHELPSTYPTFKVSVFNVLGAGDAFMSGLLKGWLEGRSWEASCRIANACGALVVSRHGCAPAMPTLAELDYFFGEADLSQPLEHDRRLQRLHRSSAKQRRWKDLAVFAFDHRSQMLELAQRCNADVARIPELKRLFVKAVDQTEQWLQHSEHANTDIGILADERYGQDALNAATGRGWWIGRPVELPGSLPIRFEYGRSIGTNLVSWPREHIIKCLINYDTEQPVPLRTEQETQIKSLYDAAQASGHDLLLEIIPPASPQLDPDTQILHAATRLYALGIQPEWWKIGALHRAESWQKLDALIDANDPYCKGVVLLGLAAPLEDVTSGFGLAAASQYCKGFTVGRTIFQAPSEAWLAGRINDDELVHQVRNNFETLITAWTSARHQTIATV
ncbi:5-dehydro-2-deoxygluconokinase [Pusillimonas sp. MFBS29]|uniref:bifunctional 5-dehydro-2-deoxygluconokinase/5-dehydro-2- deoxyphosphogluconate aldolase n=1 Tax=Pusillimonas sp. MFBS29 TaxID=2886690 RepID=UPI001D107C4C|nr:5-dehydro-2-deoxygluconokinase [Pusillimonas sp. MFBS29]MCC2597130.1 5-dehydro-2-deoxygluconokinase [Pusillimonas sp. MFBS29]